MFRAINKRVRNQILLVEIADERDPGEGTF
jgi:hypothetical protein